MVHGDNADLSDVVSDSPWLMNVQMVRNNEVQGSPVLAAYQRLYVGDLEGAMDNIQAAPDMSDTLLRMVAASDGASDDMVASALALDPGAGLNRVSLWVAVGLAMRHGRPIDDLLDSADDILGSEATVAREFFASLSSPQAAEATLSGLNQAMRGSAYAAGVVALGANAPGRWREGAKRLLFITERPYFQ